MRKSILVQHLKYTFSAEANNATLSAQLYCALYFIQKTAI